MKRKLKMDITTLFTAIGRCCRYAVDYKIPMKEMDEVSDQALADVQGLGINK